MENLSDSYLLTHAAEIRLAVGVIVSVASIALIKAIDFVATAVKSLADAAAKPSLTGALGAAAAR